VEAQEPEHLQWLEVDVKPRLEFNKSMSLLEEVSI
jgi:hypothetical protein